MYDVDSAREGTRHWLLEEIKTSNAADSNNRYLSSFTTIRDNMLIKSDATATFQKALSHANRFRPETAGFMGAFLQDPKNPEAFARLLFASLMLVSGRNRELALAQATNQTDYARRRLGLARNLSLEDMQPPSCINLQQVNANSMMNRADTLVVKPILKSIEYFQSEDCLPEHFGVEDSPAIKLHNDIRQKSLAYYTLALCYGQDTFGSLKDIPVLEPFSISFDPKIIYPFRPETWRNYEPSYRQK